MILPGSNSQALAARVAEATGRPLCRATYDRFPDGELLAAVPDFEADHGRAGADAVVVGATVSSDAHVELLQLQDAAREAGADTVATVIPYMGYARQDKSFKQGQPVSARAVAKAISTGTDRVVLVSPHEPGVADFFDVPVTIVDAGPCLADPLPEDLDDPLFVGPDDGAVDLADSVCDAYGRGDATFFEKERDYDTGEVEVRPSDAEVTDRDVVLVDDIVATGSTMSESIDALHARDVGRVFVVCVHAMLASNARTKLEAAGLSGIWGTDTLERDVSAVSVADVVAEAL